MPNTAEQKEPNLTEKNGLVRRLPSVAPYPDHYLVVFKRIGDGRELRACVQPGETFRKPFFESAESFIAVAVPADRNLRHRFQRGYKTHDQLHSYTLIFTLDYRISDPGALAQKLHLDPLKRLEDEIDLLLVQRNKSLDWFLIEREQIDLEDVLFHRSDGAHRNEETSNHGKLAEFAATHGMEVKRVVVTRELPEREIEHYAKEVETQRKNMMLFAEHQNLSTSEALARERQSQQDSYERHKGIMDNMADNFSQAFARGTEKFHSLDDLGRGIPKAAGIQNAVMGIVAGGVTAGAGVAVPGAPLLSGGGGQAALLAPTAPSSPLEAFLTSAMATLGPVDCGPVEKRQLFSFVLHLIAEALRGEEANGEMLESYAGALAGISQRLVNCLRPEQLRFLRRLQEISLLKRELS